MTTLSKPDLEQMLNFLDLTTLEFLDSKYQQDAPYTFGHRPLLKYSAEALTEYASALYRYILPHFGTIELTEDDYIALWLAPYTNIKAQLASKAENFIDQLKNIAETPTETEPNTLPPMPNRVYAEIVDYLSHKNDDFYADIIDFMVSTSSPLRRHTVTDHRVLDLIAEVDAMRAIYNQELATFVGDYSLYKDKTEKIVGPTVTKRVRYRVLEPETTYGVEITRIRQPIIDRLAFYSLSPKSINVIIAHRSLIPEGDWLTIAQALTHKVITTEVKDLIKSSKKTIEQALTTPIATATVEQADEIVTSEVFISNFITNFGLAYSKPLTVQNNATLDDIFADLDAFYQSQTEATSFEAVQDQQKSLEVWYYCYQNIYNSLLACLQISLNNINPSTAIAPEVLSHGAIKGMLVFAEQIKYLYSTGAHTIDYNNLAEELRHQLREHTGYFTEATPLPELVPTSKEQLIESGAEVLPPTTPLKPSLFDLTPPIQELLDKIGATTAIAEVEFLSVSDPQLLVPVPDYTIKQLSILLTGQPCTPYLLANGDLVIYIPATNSYVKPLPQIRDDDYVDYIFRAYNWDLLQNHIITLRKTIKNIPTYVTRNNIFIWQPLPKTIAERKLTFTQAKDYLETLLAIADECILEEDYTSHDAYEQACYTVSRIENTHYFKDLYISGHRLSKWVYSPEEYNDKIACKPVDVDGNRLYYEPNHIDLNRSNNRKENLKIELKQTNAELRSSSKPVFYQGHLYLTIKKYCDLTGAGNYKNLQKKIKNLEKLKPGTAITYLKRQYTRDTASNQIVATDLHD